MKGTTVETMKGWSDDERTVMALAAAGKRQNLALDLSEAVQSLTVAGIEVMGGFIVGFDSDGVEAFEAQRQFLAGAPLPLAMACCSRAAA